MDQSRIVVRYADGRVLKGFTRNFGPDRPVFHVTSVDDTATGPVPVKVNDLKALFFVRDFDGNSAHQEAREFSQPTQGRKVEVTFADGEIIVGSALGYSKERPGFFLFPADAESNNIRIFVVSGAVRAVRFL